MEGFVPLPPLFCVDIGFKTYFEVHVAFVWVCNIARESTHEAFGGVCEIAVENLPKYLKVDLI